MTRPNVTQRVEHPATPKGHRPVGMFQQYPGLPFVLCFVLGCIVFFELYWSFAHYPQLVQHGAVTRHQIGWWLSFAWGAFVLYVGQPIVKGKLSILTTPRRYLSDHSVAIFLQARTALSMFIAAGLLYVAIFFSPMVHLVYDTHASVRSPRPSVLAAGHVRYFTNGTISLYPEEADNVLVTDGSGVYTLALRPTDARRMIPFFTHKEIDVSRVLPTQRLVVKILDHREAWLFTIRFDDSDIDQAAVTPGTPGSGVSTWRELVDTILTELATDSVVRLLAKRDGVLTIGSRVYQYKYGVGTSENTLEIIMPQVQSVIATQPISALGVLGGMSPDERDADIEVFARDISGLSPDSREGLFLDLLQAPTVATSLRGTTAKRLSALEYIEDVISLGIDGYLSTDAKAPLLWDIVKYNLVVDAQGPVMVAAMRAAERLSRGEDSLRDSLLVEINRFVEKLGNGNNASKVQMVRSILRFVDDDTDGRSVEIIVSTLAKLYHSVSSLESTRLAIEGAILDRRMELEKDETRKMLRAVYVGGSG